MCGVGLKEEYSPVAFWILSIEQKRILFKASSWQERRDWLEAIHHASYPETGTDIFCYFGNFGSYVSFPS